MMAWRFWVLISFSLRQTRVCRSLMSRSRKCRVWLFASRQRDGHCQLPLRAIWSMSSSHHRLSRSLTSATRPSRLLIGIIALNRAPNAVEVRWPYAYTVDEIMGLFIVDVSVPSAPIGIGSLMLPPGPMMDIAVDGSLAYVANGALGLVIVNVTSPKSPSMVTQAAQSVTSIDITGEVAYSTAAIFKTLPLHCGSTTAVVFAEDEPASSFLAVAALRSWPNPATRGPISIAFHLPNQDRVRLSIYDPGGGRLVRRLKDGALTQGSHTLNWDGRDERGRPVPAGVYAYQLETAGRKHSRTLVMLR